ncbi:hypothetical protein Sru01_36730 [Sphaerisporangium rufum]|uniref:Uncharacterized protein n=1 Tax=Sphaerisporangium rufum TaxID=1381558 RepID=A0A919R5C2_9ACTN|nr:hypothetical protein [Sphaerisporangium rufum]GII78691.1 hypothetical protein Sru01_36730 [Sphaerisporangium rufum]
MANTQSQSGSGGPAATVPATRPPITAAPAGGGWRAAARWLPLLCAAGAAVAVFRWTGTPAGDIGKFAAYLVLCVAAPGTLLVRALYRGPRTFTEEIALGTAAGYAAEVLAYIPARALGAPLAVLAWPALTYLAFLGVPRLRRYWRHQVTARTPGWCAWAIAATVTGLVAYTGATHFRNNPLTWPAAGAGGYDMPFHLALISELRHHMPPAMPSVAGQPLLYHWFVYAHSAAASWITGVEPLVLLLRLGMLPVNAAFLVLIVMTARRLAGTWALTVPVLAGSVLVSTPSLYVTANMVFGWGGVQFLAWRSPTQMFAGLLFAALVILLADLLTRRRVPAGHWVLLVLFTVTVMGAKAVFLPLLLAGLAAVVAVGLLRRRTPGAPVLALAALTAGCVAFAQLVLFGGGRQGMVLAPFGFAPSAWHDLAGPGRSAAGTAGVVALHLLCWAIPACGLVGLLAAPRLALRPPVVLMLTMVAAGHVMVVLFQHPGRSQFFFLDAAYPYLVILSAYGVWILCHRAGLGGRTALAAGVAGVAVAGVIALTCGVRVPLALGRPGALIFLPYAVLVAVTVLAAAVLALTAGRRRAVALTTAAVTGIGLVACASAIAQALPGKIAAKGVDGVGKASVAQAAVVPVGLMAAARWLRDHSAPGDLVATNSHCHWTQDADPCDPQQFWGTGLSERRMLVEGWSYAPAAIKLWRPDWAANTPAFWDPALLRLNDAAIERADAASLARLRDRYGVRWLLADTRRVTAPDRLAQLAPLAYRSGVFAVHRVIPGPGTGSR